MLVAHEELKPGIMQHFNETVTELALVDNYFRRSGDHELALYVDLSQFYMNSTMPYLLAGLEVPVPDTSDILMSSSRKMDSITRHLINLVVNNESTLKFTSYFDA